MSERRIHAQIQPHKMRKQEKNWNTRAANFYCAQGIKFSRVPWQKNKKKQKQTNKLMPSFGKKVGHS